MARDLIGQRFGKLTVTDYEGIDKHGHHLWNCLCDCGNAVIIPSGNLTSNVRKSCGCIRRNDLTGKRFGNLTALKDAGKDSRGARMWRCKCDCGNIIRTKGASLISGNTASCGCLTQPDLIGQRFGRLVVISLIGNERRKRLWACRCDCGKTTTRPTSALTTGHTKSCGCLGIEHVQGKNNPRWLGGKSFEPYCQKFNETLKENVRESFGRKCYLCGTSENGRKLSVHHINFDKTAGCYGKRWNLIPLCTSCHTKTTNERHYYFNLLNCYWAFNPEINLL